MGTIDINKRVERPWPSPMLGDSQVRVKGITLGNIPRE